MKTKKNLAIILTACFIFCINLVSGQPMNDYKKVEQKDKNGIDYLHNDDGKYNNLNILNAIEIIQSNKEDISSFLESHKDNHIYLYFNNEAKRESMNLHGKDRNPNIPLLKHNIPE